ncbi:hypothetical protein ACHAWF_014287 [Thalassiosira exigua]
MRNLLLSLLAFHNIMTTARALVSTSAWKRHLRIELFFSSTDELRERIGFLRSKGITSFNLVNKSNKDKLLESVKIIESEFSEEIRNTSICVHYSLKYNKSRKVDGAFHRFHEFVTELDELNHNKELLLVSGSGPKGKFNSLTALQTLRKESANVSCSVAVAFNPFFPDQADYDKEISRLSQKIESGMVSKVYLQFGTNLERLKTALQLLKKRQTTSAQKFQICGSIFLPTKKLIAQQRFRPWNGVFLSDDFLASEDSARGIVLQMMKLYEEFGSEILIEAPGIRTQKDWLVLESLLAERDDDKVIERQNQSCSANDSKNSKRRKIGGTTTAGESKSPPIIPEGPAVVLFHSHDVRLFDNPAIRMASRHGRVVPVFLWSRREQGMWGATGCLEVVLKDALHHIERKLKEFDLMLICREGNDSSKLLQKIAEECNAGAVYWNKEHTPEGQEREERYRKILNAGFHGGHWGTLMPFLNACKKQLGDPRVPMSRADTFSMLEAMTGPEKWPESIRISELGMAVVNGKYKWDVPILERFPMSEEDALSSMNEFFSDGFAKYEQERSRADIRGSTSKLSAHLRVGTLSPNELYYRIEGSSMAPAERKTFSRRLFWRDLAYFQLQNFPTMRDESIRRHYENIAWCSGEEEEKRFNAWKKGLTGYPLVDAGMRELYATGWMTQSLRMVVASFLVEYLRVNWVKGCEWFHYTLVDADSAINPMMWQNAGRSGIDQWNFSMSPVAASQDPTGSYTRKWVPELAKLPKSVLHRPWEAPSQVLQAADVVLGSSYPSRIITDLKRERAQSVEAVLEARRQNQQFNNDRGYDIVNLPNGKQTVLFTKKEFRIDRQGNAIVEAPRGASSRAGSGRGRRGKAAQKKLLRKKAAVKK